jgi:hypothetical protein
MSENKNSQYDPGLIVKEVHDFYAQAIRVRDTNSLNSQHFTHFSATYDVNNNPTQVIYYRGVTSHITNIGCVADVAGSLNNKYFTLRACPSNALYHVWFNVGGAGVAPVVANSTGVQVQINQNDPAIVVSTAIRLTLNTLYSGVFKASQTGATLEIRTVGFGVCSNSADVNTGFAIANTQGTQVVTDTINISYSGTDPIFNGQVLKGYKYDIWGGSFEPSSSASVSITAPVISSGTDDGTPSGTPYVFVNNEFSQILAAGDRVDQFIYADAGTKNERVTEINTTSTDVHPGKTAKKSIAYTLVGNSYVLTSITKSVI